MKTEHLKTDILIIGGGTAGCYAALTLAEEAPELSVLVCEKADIRRSGYLAAGVNALNAYITDSHVPQDDVDDAKKDAAGIVREDLLYTMSERLNEATHRLERLVLVIQKDEQGRYVSREWRALKIIGENIKPLLAAAVDALPQTRVLNRVAITDLAV